MSTPERGCFFLSTKAFVEHMLHHVYISEESFKEIMADKSLRERYFYSHNGYHRAPVDERDTDHDHGGAEFNER